MLGTGVQTSTFLFSSKTPTSAPEKEPVADSEDDIASRSNPGDGGSLLRNRLERGTSPEEVVLDLTGTAAPLVKNWAGEYIPFAAPIRVWEEMTFSLVPKGVAAPPGSILPPVDEDSLENIRIDVQLGEYNLRKTDEGGLFFDIPYLEKKVEIVTQLGTSVKEGNLIWVVEILLENNYFFKKNQPRSVTTMKGYPNCGLPHGSTPLV